MISIEALGITAPAHRLEEARVLFRAYGDFLRTTVSHANFGFARFEEEIATLPAEYVMKNGELLAAAHGEDVLAGCVAYRLFPGEGEAGSCEIKRLFVRERYRGQGIGRQLMESALERAKSRGYRFAYLDTELNDMAIAYRTYVGMGFVEYGRRCSEGGETLVLLRRPLW